MIDTVVLTLTKGMFYINEPDLFEPSARLVLGDGLSIGGKGYIVAKQNPRKRDLENGIYKPRLTLTNRFNGTGGREPTLKIELSLPKLLFGNNFDELVASDFSFVAELLKSRLRDMGVRVMDETLKNAPVSSVHYAKNIPLTDGTTPHYIIGKIKEANIKLSLDVNQTDFRNEGHNYKWHANSYEVAFYDKIKDLEASKMSEKRALEKDNAIQLGLFDTIKEKKRFEVLRMEVRLNKRQKIGHLFSSLGIKLELTFKGLFNPTISQKVLLHYLDYIESKRPILLNYKTTTSKALLSDLIVRNPQMGPQRILQAFGLKQVFDTVNPRELRAMFGRKSKRSWYRLISEAKKIKLPPTTSPLVVIREYLAKFIPLKLVDFK
jgi:hypothetical protein